MSNFYGGKQGFSFFISKLYILEKNQDGETITYSDNGIEYTSIDSFLVSKFNNDSDVHYNDYVLLGITAGGLSFNSTDPNHGNLYRKDIVEFKLVGNLAGPPGGTSQVLFFDWDALDTEYIKDETSVSNKELKEITPVGEDNIVSNIKLVSGKTNSQLKVKYYCAIQNNLTSTLKVAIESPVPYIDFTGFYLPEETSAPPLIMRDESAVQDDNFYYQPYKSPIVTKFYKPRISNDELYGDLYEYKKNKGNEKYSYQITKRERLGQIKQENGILIGKHIVYYILKDDAGTQSDTDLQSYLTNKSKRDTLLNKAQTGYVLVVNQKLICKKLNDDYPCGLGYGYGKTESGDTDTTSRVVTNIDLAGKVVSYGGSLGPVVEGKVVTWFFGYDFSRENTSDKIVPNWYLLKVTTSQIKIVYAEDQTSTEGDTVPATSQEVKAGDLWVGLMKKELLV